MPYAGYSDCKNIIIRYSGYTQPHRYYDYTITPPPLVNCKFYCVADLHIAKFP